MPAFHAKRVIRRFRILTSCGFRLSAVFLWGTLSWPGSVAAEEPTPSAGKQETLERLQQMRAEERRQNEAMVPPDVKQALSDLKEGKATEKQRALLFKNNDLVNRAGILGAIDNATYQSAQRDYAAINRHFGKNAVESTGGVFGEQKRAPDKPYDPGTDSDYIAKVTSAGQVKKIQGNYNQQINGWLEKNGVLDEARSDWHNKLDTDFMADPDHKVSESEFREISRQQNAAYETRKAARAEAMSRMSPAELRQAGVPGGKVPLEESTAYVKELDRLSRKKAGQVDQTLNQDPERREALKSDPNARAELHKTQAQEQKYIQRKQETAERTREQHGLEGPKAPERPEITKEDRRFVEDLARQRKEEALAKGKSPEEADQAEKNVLKSLEQNDRPPEKPMSDLPGQAAKRSPDNRAEAQAASALSGHLSKQATNGYTQTLAERAGKDSSVEKQTQADIASLSKDFTPSEKAEVIERSRQQYEKGMKNELVKTLDPETAGKVAADKADAYARGLAAEMRGQGGAAGSGEASQAVQGPRDVAVFGPKARVTPIDNRETSRPSAGGLDEGDVIDIAKSAYNAGNKLGEAAQATLQQKEELSKRAKALDDGDLDAALRHQRRAAQYGEQARESMGDAVVEGLNGVPLDKVGGLQGNDKVKAAVSLGDYAKSAYETGRNYGEASLSLHKAGDYQEKAAQAEARGETRVADQYRRLAADAQLQGVERGIEAIRETPIIGGGFKLGEARVLHDQAAALRERASQAVKRGDLDTARQLNAQAAQLDERKKADIKGALDNIPLLGGTAKKYGELGASYGAIQQKLGDSSEYKRKAKEARERGENQLATKYDALAARNQAEAYRSLTETVESTPVAGTMQELSRALIALKRADRERELAELARKAGDEVAAKRHENQALVREKEAGDNIDKFKQQAPAELAAIVAITSSYGPHAVLLTAMYKGSRHVIENTEKGRRLEEAKTEGLTALIESSREAQKKLSGEKTTREQLDEDVVRLQQAWQRKLDSGEIQLRPGMSHEDFMSAIALMKSANRKAASLSDLGLLDAYVEVRDKTARPGESGESPPEETATLSGDGAGSGWGDAEAEWGEGDFGEERSARDARIAQIIAMSSRCAYQDAHQLAQQLRAEEPDNEWVKTNYAAIGEWAQREKTYHQAIGSAHRAVQASNLDLAISALKLAMANAATQCRQDQVVRQILDQALALANDGGRQAAIERAKREWQSSRSARSSGYTPPAPAPSGDQGDNAQLINSLTNLMRSINRASNAGGSSGSTGTNVNEIYRNLNTQRWDDAARQKSRDPSAFMPKGYQPRPGNPVPAPQRSGAPARSSGPGQGEFSVAPGARSAPAPSKPKLWNCNAGGRGCRYDDGWHDNRGRVFATQEEMNRANGW